MDFGRVALAGGFLTSEQFENEQKYPLRLFFCDDCCAVQVVDKVSADVLFQDYFYFSSSITTLRTHFYEYAVEMTSRFLIPDKATVIEIGCNDGTMLNFFNKKNFNCLGFEPSTNVAEIDPPANISSVASRDCTADIAPFKQATDWEPHIQLHDGIKITAQHLLENMHAK